MKRERANSEPAGAVEERQLFYGSVLDEADLVAALRIEGIDEEVAALRLELRRLLGDDERDGARVLKVAEVLVRAVSQRHRMSPHDAADLENAIAAIEPVVRALMADPMEREV